MKKYLVLVIATLITSQAFAAKVTLYNRSGRDIQARYYQYFEGTFLESSSEEYGPWTNINNCSDATLINESEVITEVHIKDQGKTIKYTIGGTGGFGGVWKISSYFYTGPTDVLSAETVGSERCQ